MPMNTVVWVLAVISLCCTSGCHGECEDYLYEFYSEPQGCGGFDKLEELHNKSGAITAERCCSDDRHLHMHKCTKRNVTYERYVCADSTSVDFEDLAFQDFVHSSEPESLAWHHNCSKPCEMQWLKDGKSFGPCAALQSNVCVSCD